MYDLFREFSPPALKQRSLFCCLSSREHIPERLTALLALQHPDVPLLAPPLLMQALQEVRRPDEPPERRGKRERHGGEGLVKIDQKVGAGVGGTIDPRLPEHFGSLPPRRLARPVIDPTGLDPHRFCPLPLGLTRRLRCGATGRHCQRATDHLVGQLCDRMEHAALGGHARARMLQGTLQPVGAVADHQVCGGLGAACEGERAQACLPGVGPFAFRSLPMPDVPGPSGPPAQRAAHPPRLLALARATTARGIAAARARGRGALDPHALDQEHRWRSLQGVRLAPCEGLGHTRHTAVTGRKGAPCTQRPCQRFWHVPSPVPQTLAQHLVVQQRPPAALRAGATLPGQRAVTPAPFGPGHVGKGAVRREPCALRAPTADRLGWATPGERCIALHSQRGAPCFFSSRCDDGLHGGAHGVLHREAKVGVDVAWETRTMDPLHVVMHVAAMGHLLGLAPGTSLHGIRVHTTLVLRDVPSVFNFAQSSVHYLDMQGIVHAQRLEYLCVPFNGNKG